MFHVGQFCECITDEFSADAPRWPTVPRRGGVYTVRSVFHGHIFGVTCEALRLEEIVCGYSLGVECGWAAFRFRPLQDSKLEVFRALLVDLPALPKFEPTKEKV